MAGKGRMARWAWKPLHGWRRFLGEVGTIVLGVLIALGLGSIATAIGWRVEASAAREAISLELGEALGTAIERTHFAHCVDRRLDELAWLVDRAATTGRLPPLGDIRSPPLRSWNRGIWESSVSAQTTSHFDRAEHKAYVTAYYYIDTLGAANRREMMAWTELYSLVGPGRALSPVDTADLRRALGAAREVNRHLEISAVRLQQLVEAYDLPFDNAAMREFSDRPFSDKEICQPVDANVPQSYGQSPFRTTLGRVRKSPITRLTH